MENSDHENPNDQPPRDDWHGARPKGNYNNPPIRAGDDKRCDPVLDSVILAWARKFLPEYFTDQPADFHRELMSDLADPRKRLLARVAPRGHAKSTCISLAYPLWAICERKRRNIVIVSNESTLAKQFVRDIRAELEANTQIRETYGDLFALPDHKSDHEAAHKSEHKSDHEAEHKSEHESEQKSEHEAPASSIRTHHASGGPSPRGKKPTKNKKPVAPNATASPRKNAASKKSRSGKTAEKTNPASRRSNIPTASPVESAGVANMRPKTNATAKKRRPKNSETYFTTTSGVTVQAKGAGAAFRGLRVGPNRPDLILCDDIEKDAQVNTAEGRQKLEHWLRRVVLPALAPEGRIVLIGSILHSDSLLAALADAKRWPRWDYRVYRALEAVPAPQSGAFSEPQAQARGAQPEPGPKAKKATAGEFSAISDPVNGHSRSECSTNGQHLPYSEAPAASSTTILPAFHFRALWPARWPVARLLEERERIGTLAFEQEYQANPIDDATRIFRPDRLHRTSANEIEKLDRENRLSNLLAIDPATGTTSGDFFALWAGGVDSQTGIIHTRELTLERIGIVEQVRRIVAACQRYKPVRVGIETVAYQAALHQVLEEVSRARSLYIPLVPIKTVANKRARIEGSACFYESGTFRLPAFLPPEVELQFLQFPKAKHDDAPDVCAMAIELARSLRTLSGSLVLFRRFNNPFNRPGGW